MEPLLLHPSPLIPLAPRPRPTTALAFAPSAPSRMPSSEILLTRPRLRRWQRLRAVLHTPHSKLRLSRNGDQPEEYRSLSDPPLAGKRYEQTIGFLDQ